MTVVDRESVAVVPWGTGCLAWPMAEADALSVKLEEMPPDAQEVRYRHARARQVFFVLAGVLDMEREGVVVRIGPEQALEVPPGVPHQARNGGSAPVRFLVISGPTTRGDREDVASSPGAPAGRTGA
ncbi:cupin domain-containing protein [uncultured Roseobacter sp.]|uniref:cupin domain-containing protein n=1 Tax=uncultured Roseobacter sp. TaxID=114847 RepID=UPI00260A9ACF|nr:cupin domain-containing protein [uncultured Roseobacter sp.]